jgi:hypothetical protein
MKRVLFVALAALIGQVHVASAENLSIVIRTFIPKEHPGIPGYMLPVKGDASHTTLPEAPVGQCFGTDNRSFSNEANASSRFGGLITVDVTAGTAPTLSLITGVTKEYDCDTGQIVCEKTAGAGGFKIANVNVSGNIVSFTYEGEASNPCLALAPDIEFTGTVRIDRSARTVTIDGKNDVFPSFEAVLFTASGAKSLFRMDPEGQSTPADLLTSSANRPASATKPY